MCENKTRINRLANLNCEYFLESSPCQVRRIVLEGVFMSLKSSAIWRVFNTILSYVGLHEADVAIVQTAPADIAPHKLYATIEVIAPPEPPNGGNRAALPLPILAQTAALATMYRPAAISPLASQLAYTARRNVPKGRKPARTGLHAPKPVYAAARRTRTNGAKAKPIIQVAAKKQDLKRRHHWLANERRVIKTGVGNNVLQLGAQRTPTAARTLPQKFVIRSLKLAA